MLVCPVDAETIDHCEATELARVIDLLQRVEPDTPIPNSKWTAHDVGAHLVTVIGRYLKPDRKLPTSPREIDVINEQEMLEFKSATMGELVGRLRSRNAKYVAFWPELPVDQQLQVRSGIPLDVAALRTNWISELAIHGRDVALATGEPWQLDNNCCLLTLRLMAYMLPSYLRPGGQSGDILVVAPDGAMPFSLVIKGTVAEMQPGAIENADQLAGAPEALVLLFYGRIGLAEALAMGARVVGDPDRVDRILYRYEKP